MKHSKKVLDFEVNLIPFIDLLSVSICFLLITAVWLNVGSMNVKQAVGGQAKEDTKKTPQVWVRMTAKGDLDLEVQQSSLVPAALRKLRVAQVDSKVDWAGFEKALASLKQVEPSLNTGLIQPTASTSYEDIIDAMDRLKKNGMTDLGVSPL
ncbi:ExbD/TolR family protein [Bdellovibrio sp. HCB2-146]|uniref:ExbD/TolR family protein n=1 Tax=Bdellovibrio sp. HCB2-146 TaxID=3394362 RepID=UPI0039BC51E1